jgi:hypothetical protein
MLIFTQALSGSLVNILKAANQPVPESLLKFGTTVKKKEHSAYGAFYKDTEGYTRSSAYHECVRVLICFSAM